MLYSYIHHVQVHSKVEEGTYMYISDPHALSNIYIVPPGPDKSWRCQWSFLCRAQMENLITFRLRSWIQ